MTGNLPVSLNDLFSSIQDELDNIDDLKDGLSFLDLKNDTFLSYMIEVCNIMLKKMRGQSIEGSKSVDRSVEYRVILEKVKGIDRSIAYQLNKIISMPDDATSDEQRVDIKNLDIDLDNDEDGAYKPPKLRSAHSASGVNQLKMYQEDNDVDDGSGNDSDSDNSDAIDSSEQYEEDNYTRLPPKRRKRIKSKPMKKKKRAR